MMMRDIEDLEGRPVFSRKAYAQIMIGGLACYWGLLIVAPPTASLSPSGLATPFAIFLILGLGLTLVWMRQLVLVDRHIKVALGSKVGVADAFGVLLLAVLAGLAFPIVQQRLNALIARRQTGTT
jgi:hypothetical protein